MTTKIGQVHQAKIQMWPLDLILREGLLDVCIFCTADSMPDAANVYSKPKAVVFDVEKPLKRVHKLIPDSKSRH
jgi:hypothetical protein